MKEFFGEGSMEYDVWKSKYQFNGETKEQFFNRLIDNFSRSFEYHEDLSDYGKERLKNNYTSKLRELFYNFKYVLPGGSVYAGIGTGKPVSLSNCYVTGISDSVSSIFNGAKNMANIYKRRGGNGTDMTPVRPRGGLVNNAAETTTGIIPFMGLYSETTRIIGQDGRRGALMLSLDIRHPDSPEFAVCKRDTTKITGANISLKMSKDFILAVENDEDYILRWPVDLVEKNPEINELDMYQEAEYNTLYPFKISGKTVGYTKLIRAKELWETIIESNWLSGEPGILFWDEIIDYDPASVYESFKAISTNPCVIPSTTLLTKEGFKPIIDLVGIDTDIWNGHEWTKVKPFKTSDNDDVYQVKFSDGSDLTCTEYHEFILKGGIRKELKDLVVGDKIEKFTYPIIKYDDSPVHNVKNWYTQGFYSGDGTIANEEGRSNRYFIDLYGDKIDLIDYLNVEKYGNLDDENNKLRTKVNDLINPSKLFVPYNSHIHAKDRLAWLAGLIDSDGTLNDSGGSIAITSVEENFLLEVKKLLITLGIRSTVGINKKAQTKNIKGTDYDCQTCYRLVISAWYVAELRELGLVTKRVKIDANPNRNAARFIQIKSIEHVGTSDVYCVTDEKNHSALFNDVMTGQCGEIPLNDRDACRLVHTNVFELVRNPFTDRSSIDSELAYKVFYEAQIIADTLVSVELEHIKRIIEVDDEPDFWREVYDIGQRGRRTGTGLTALGDFYAALGVEYGNENYTHHLMRLKLRAEFDASTDLAIVEGPFPEWNVDNEFMHPSTNPIGKNRFYQMLLDEFPTQAKRMIEFGRRNISPSTIAPTGTTSLMSKTSSGCEPMFLPFYTRRKKVNANDKNQRVDFVDDVGDKWQEYGILHPKFKDWCMAQIEDKIEGMTKSDQVDNMSVDQLQSLFELSPWFGQTANDLTPEVRIKTQSILQKYTSHSISSTVNLPKDVAIETVNEVYLLASKMGLKGVTTYRDGSRSGVLVSEPVNVVTERPESIECKVMRFKNEKKNWVAFIGILNGKPFEIFTGINDIDAFPIPSSVVSGTIIKVPTSEGSRYDFRYVDSYGYTNTLGGLNRIFSKEFWNYARLTSAILKEQVEIVDVIRIIEKLEFSVKSLNTWQSGVIRALSSFVADGTTVKELCSNCGEDALVYQEGCPRCTSCGFSQCG